MADIKNITIDGTTYDLKDAKAREDVSDLKEDIKDNYAKIDGYYDGMTVGNAEQIVGTVFEEDDTAYNYRTTGGSAEVGDRAYVDAITGVSLPWNQLTPPINSTNWTRRNSDATVSYNEGVMSFIASAQNAGIIIVSGYRFTSPANHVYYQSADIKLESGTGTIRLRTCQGLGDKDISATTSWQNASSICKTTSEVANCEYSVYDRRTEDFTTVYVKNPVWVDLTAMFGSTIADYIYALETAHAGDGVAWFKRYFPKPYYAYHAVGMEHVNAVAAKTVGFNQWDEELEIGTINISTGENESASTQTRSKNYIPVFPNTTYYFACESYSGDNVKGRFYDADKNYIGATPSDKSTVVLNETFTTPPNCYFMRFGMQTGYGTTYKNDINISIRWDNSRDGDYEPYNLHTYPLADLTLRGIPKKDESGNLYFDGDRYLPDGSVERRYGIVDLGTLTWSIGGLPQASSGLRKRMRTFSIDTIAKPTVDNDGIGNVICTKFPTSSYNDIYGHVYVLDTLAIDSDGDVSVVVPDSAYSTGDEFKAAMSGVYLVYELKTPTTEEADPYQYPMVVDNWGTEAFVDGLVESGDRDVAIPVGHETKYPPNLKDKLESAANNPDADGAYILTHDGGSNTYTPLASNATIQNIIARLEALEGGGE